MTSFIRTSAEGASGVVHELWAYQLGTHFEDSAGIYIFCSLAREGYWVAHYVGQADSLQSRVGSGLPLHHKVSAAKAIGATHVAVMGVVGRDERCSVEHDLIQGLSPPLNEKAAPGFGFRNRA